MLGPVWFIVMFLLPVTTVVSWGVHWLLNSRHIWDNHYRFYRDKRYWMWFVIVLFAVLLFTLIMSYISAL